MVLATMWVLGAKLRVSVRADSALNLVLSLRTLFLLCTALLDGTAAHSRSFIKSFLQMNLFTSDLYYGLDVKCLPQPPGPGLEHLVSRWLVPF